MNLPIKNFLMTFSPKQISSKNVTIKVNWEQGIFKQTARFCDFVKKYLHLKQNHQTSAMVYYLEAKAKAKRRQSSSWMLWLKLIFRNLS